MSKFELPKEPKFYNYDCPIDKIVKQVHDDIIKQEEDLLMYEVKHSVGFVVDKNELIKALNYDREQYDKGYRDGVKETFKAELEEIKTEIINKKCKYCDIDSNIQKCHEDNFTICDVYDILDILDNHIKELNNEICN